MKEIGGYIELDDYHLPMMYDNGIRLNCGRNALAYLIDIYDIKNIALPYFLCSSVKDICLKLEINIDYYHIDEQFMPLDLKLKANQWLYLVNFYGQLDNNQIIGLKKIFKNIIVDNAQAYFNEPIENIDTIYTCRKFFGVPDGAFLFTGNKKRLSILQDESYQRMTFLLGRYERNANEFYNDYLMNNKLFKNQPIKQMSKLTFNLLHGIDYEYIKNKRTNNYRYLYNCFKSLNMLCLKEIEGAYAYPLLIKDGYRIRKELQKFKIYIPTLWPNVLEDTSKDSLEYQYALNILPLPVDQRYDIEDMKYIEEMIKGCID